MTQRLDCTAYVLDSRHRAWRIGALLGNTIPGVSIPWRLFNETREFCEAVRESQCVAAFVAWDDDLVELMDEIQAYDGSVTYFVTMLDPFAGPRLARQLGGYYVPAVTNQFIFNHFVKARLITAISRQTNLDGLHEERRAHGHQ